MRSLLLILLIFLTKFSFGQSRYYINYSKPTTLNILYEDSISNEMFYSIEYLNMRNQPVKNITRKYRDDHSTKRDFSVDNFTKYYFYTDTFLSKEITIDPDFRKFYLTKHFYDTQGNYLGWESFSLKPKISKDSFTRILTSDYYLNDPDNFPITNLILETKEVKQFENSKLIYKCYYERYGKMKEAMPARENFYKYNNKKQLIEYISNPKSEAGGTAFLKSIYEYNDLGQMVTEHSYSDGKYKSVSEVAYSDNIIKEIIYFLNDKGLKTSSTYEEVFEKKEDGNFYNKYGFKFSLTNGDE